MVIETGPPRFQLSYKTPDEAIQKLNKHPEFCHRKKSVLFLSIY